MRLTKLNTKNFDEFKILLLNGKTNLSELFRVINVFRLQNLLLFFKFVMKLCGMLPNVLLDFHATPEFSQHIEILQWDIACENGNPRVDSQDWAHPPGE